MGSPRGFITYARHKTPTRPVADRLTDCAEIDLLLSDPERREQAARCMDCGVPFCHWACPLHNLVPEWNDLVFRGDKAAAATALLVTNNFPEVTSRVCPALCEASCVLNIEGSPVTIKDNERAISAALEAAAAKPQRAAIRLGKSVAVVGSGPAGLAAAQQLARLGYDVTVFERDSAPGGILRFGIPDFKLDKRVLDWRQAQLSAEGVCFATGVEVGVRPTGGELCSRFDAVVLAIGARRPRDLTVPGRELDGVHFAMDYLAQHNRRVAGTLQASEKPLIATGKRVVVLGGGDTGSDCLGTALRQGAASVQQLELLPKPSEARRAENPWPEWPVILRTSSSHEEGGGRDFGVMTKELIGEAGRLKALRAVRVEMKGGKLCELPGTEHTIECDLVLLAMGFTGPEPTVPRQLGVALDARGNIVTDAQGATNVRGVFAAGDAARGASLVVWAIAEGRKVASGVDAFLVTQRSRSAGQPAAAAAESRL